MATEWQLCGASDDARSTLLTSLIPVTGWLVDQGKEAPTLHHDSFGLRQEQLVGGLGADQPACGPMERIE